MKAKSRTTLKTSKTSFNLSQMEQDELNGQLERLTLNAEEPKHQPIVGVTINAEEHKTNAEATTTQGSPIFELLEQRFKSHAQAASNAITSRNEAETNAADQKMTLQPFKL